MHYLSVLLWKVAVSGGQVPTCQNWMSAPQGEGTWCLLWASHLWYEVSNQSNLLLLIILITLSEMYDIQT